MKPLSKELEDYYRSVQRASTHLPTGIRVSWDGKLICDRCGEAVDRHYAMQPDAKVVGPLAFIDRVVAEKR